jgi:hypothetical protein
MSDDEKMCPLTRMTCYAGECAWWRHPGCCAVSAITTSIHGVDLEIGRAVNELYMIRQNLDNLEGRL